MLNLSNFYQSDLWVNFLKVIKDERTNAKGILLCEHCGKPIVKKYDCIGHHIKELTDANVNDFDVSLNPENVMLIHHRCHNEIHERFGYAQRKVFIVYGPPCSGKTTFVLNAASGGDLIVDIDSLWEATTNNERYIKPNRLKENMFKLRDELIDQIYTGVGHWKNAYIIGGYPFEMERERLREKLGAELIFIDTPKEECLERAAERPREYVRYIEEWFERSGF